ncbi:DUF317 domain-containing protein [Streptomyces jumonjinensis]|uniref:DUF317 domain-containing protein n=1 Tax=Streptomyces jumonjinensis TaxID=1945 RepID=A0A646KTF7_STRJU|nr:DUF317 domain-containing protein [Streptomyces jumonjinensis]MQT05380.1 DUF317 domain-containing protein [Streptomyces jumonjinensis]
MPPAEEIDGDVFVSPVYLAGSTYTGDPALRPLLDAGFHRLDDDLGNIYLSSPDQRIRVGWLPEGEDDALWRITGHEQPFAPPRWLATFDHYTPVEIVAAFTTALAEDQTHGNNTSGHGRLGTSKVETFIPLSEAGWRFSHGPYASSIQPPDRLALVTYITKRLNHHEEISDQRSKWTVSGGTSGYSSEWLGTFTTHTPAHLVAATMNRLADPAPVARYDRHLPERNRAASRITPVKPPVPSPLDIQRAAVARSRSTVARTVIPSPALVYRTTTALPATAPARRH